MDVVHNNARNAVARGYAHAYSQTSGAPMGSALARQLSRAFVLDTEVKNTKNYFTFYSPIRRNLNAVFGYLVTEFTSPLSRLLASIINLFY